MPLKEGIIAMDKKYPMTTAGMVKPGMRVGAYTLRDGYGGHDKVWIEHGSGEGGDFSAEELEKLIKDFYDERF